MKHQETEIQKLKDEHQLALSRISHEIRNPVTLINSSMQIIEAEHPEVTNFAYWSEMKTDMQFLRHLLDEFSGYNNSDKLMSERISTYTFLSEIAFGAKALSENPDIHFTYHIDASLPDITGDITKIRQAVTNLLRNAFESGASEVSLTGFMENGNLLIQISDNGCGISEEEKKDLFTPFVTHKKNGTGLGLPIVQRIIQAHGGKITYHSGRTGTSFRLSFPANTAASKNPAIIPPKCAM